jgi:hypothetical protein
MNDLDCKLGSQLKSNQGKGFNLALIKRVEGPQAKLEKNNKLKGSMNLIRGFNEFN